MNRFNRYQLARLFCWFMRKLGYAVMLYPDHFGHQAGDVEFDMRTKNKKLLYLAGIIPNKALLKMHRRYVTVIPIPKWLKHFFIESQIAYDCLDEALSRDLRFYNQKEIWAGKPSMEFSEDEKAYGDALLKQLGLEKGQYVCFHSRDPNYGSIHHPEVIAARMSKRMVSAVGNMTEEHPFQKHRNANFDLYLLAIMWLEKQGIKAVRIGSHAEFGYEHPNLVDYASDREKLENPDLADLYLMAHCRLYVGQATGVTHLSCIFNTPGVCVNWFPFHPASRPTINIMACRVKRLRVNGEVLSEFRSRHFFELATWPQIYAASSEFEVVDNSPQEILDTIVQAMGNQERLAA